MSSGMQPEAPRPFAGMSGGEAVKKIRASEAEIFAIRIAVAHLAERMLDMGKHTEGQRKSLLGIIDAMTKFSKLAQ